MADVEEEEIEASIGAFAMIIGTVQQYFLAFILSYLLFWVVSVYPTVCTDIISDIECTTYFRHTSLYTLNLRQA